jgi:CRP-like cAMP-binding protein
MKHANARTSSSQPEDDLFAGCGSKQLAEIARLGAEIAVAPGRVLLHEGEPGRQFCVIKAGRARVELGGEFLGWVEAGSFFGEMALLDNTSCVATVTAETPMLLWVFDRCDFRRLMELNFPAVTHRMLATVGRRLRVTDRHLAELGSRETERGAA